MDSYEQLKAFVRTVSEGSPVRHFIVHARKCFLHGLNPAQNRSVPPLRHEWVYSLRRDFPDLLFSLNGGVQNCHEAKAAILYKGPFPTPGHTESRHLIPDAGRSSGRAAEAASQQSVAACGTETDCVGDGDRLTAGNGHNDAAVATVAQAGPEAQADPTVAGSASGAEGTSGCVPTRDSDGLLEGVMIGRAAYNDPWACLSDADRAVFGEADNAAASRREVRHMLFVGPSSFFLLVLVPLTW